MAFVNLLMSLKYITNAKEYSATFAITFTLFLIHMSFKDILYNHINYLVKKVYIKIGEFVINDGQ